MMVTKHSPWKLVYQATIIAGCFAPKSVVSFCLYTTLCGFITYAYARHEGLMRDWKRRVTPDDPAGPEIDTGQADAYIFATNDGTDYELVVIQG
jgi:hypothetical protein